MSFFGALAVSLAACGFAEEQQRPNACGEAGQHRAGAPDKNTNQDQPFARSAISEITKKRRGQEVAEHEGSIDAPGLGITAHVQFIPQSWKNGGDDLPIEIIEQVEPGQNE